MSREMQNRISLNNANALADEISVAAANVVEVNMNDSETVTIQTAIQAQVDLLLQRNSEIHQPLQRDTGDTYQADAIPLIVSAEVNDEDPNKMILVFNVEVADEDGGGYSLSGSVAATAVTGAEAVGSTVTLTLNGAVANGETVLTSYDGLAGLHNANVTPIVEAAAYTDFPVTNNVAA